MKCKICGQYEGKEKEVGKKKLSISDNIEFPIIHFWKWCKINNDWCRNVAGSCKMFAKKFEGESR